jgi:phosphopantetheinyl transferase (holo-ACP synthase)
MTIVACSWAAKEAVIKAFESRRITYHDIMISSPPLVDGMSQKPVAMVISEEGDWDDAQVVQVSISHTEEYATAVCIVGK